MTVAIVTGAAGLTASETALHSGGLGLVVYQPHSLPAKIGTRLWRLARILGRRDAEPLLHPSNLWGVIGFNPSSIVAIESSTPGCRMRCDEDSLSCRLLRAVGRNVADACLLLGDYLQGCPTEDRAVRFEAEMLRLVTE